METLLPCRACGNDATVAFAELGGSSECRNLRRAWVACSSCLRRTHDFDSVDDALADWNQAQRSLELDPAGALDRPQAQPELDDAEPVKV